MNCIIAKKKCVVFESCVFDSSFNLFHICEEKRGGYYYYECDINPLFSSDYSTDFTAYNLNAWIYVGNADFKRCVFQNYGGGLPLLNMQNGNIVKSRFINCRKINWHGYTYGYSRGNVTFTYLLKIANGSIVDTDFEKCSNRVVIKGNDATGCFLLADNTDIANCKFTKCQNWVGGDFGRYASNYTYLLHLSSNSSVKDCVFDECYSEAKHDSDNHVESYTIACYKGNVSMVKKLTDTNEFINGSDTYRWQKEKVGVTNREIE